LDLKLCECFFQVLSLALVSKVLGQCLFLTLSQLREAEQIEMLIRKNTKAFKTILEIVQACQSRADREKLIRLYIVKAGHSIEDRISVEGIQGDSEVFYELNYHTVLTYLNSPNHQLHQSEEVPGIYFFRSTSNKVWDEAPFEFDEAVKKEFASLPELPSVRKKGKAEKFVLPTPKTKPELKGKKEKAPAIKPAKVWDDEPKQPAYKLKHKIQFTDLDKVIFRQPKMSKKDVLDYYNKIADYLLPYLKDRVLSARRHSDKEDRNGGTDLEDLFADKSSIRPDWIQTAALAGGKAQKQALLCNDKDHLLLYAEMGFVEFGSGLARMKSVDEPDYMVIVIDSRDRELTKVKEVALAAKDILTGLQLPSFVKMDGLTALHIYIPLDAKSKFDKSKNVAEYICKLIRLKIPAATAMEGSDDDYAKVYLSFSLNEKGRSVIAPYSLLPGQSAIVATPLNWEEIDDKLRPEDFDPETIIQRVKRRGDPFEGLFKKKVSADTLLERLEENYSFLF
jgi:DNA ligase D-like protein (predicted polymerase)